MMTPGGIRLGTGALTTRGFLEADMERIASYMVKSVEITLRIQEKTGKKLVDFEKALPGDEEVQKLAAEVTAYAREFSIPGV